MKQNINYVLGGVLIVLLIVLITKSVQTPDKPEIVMPEEKETFVVDSINPDEFKNLAEEGYTIIDIRTPEEWAEGKLDENALEIDFYKDDFTANLSNLDKNGKYLVYCRSGNRSDQALSIFQQLGFSEVHDLRGGINMWNKLGMNLNDENNREVMIACTMDAFECPGGVFVGRTGSTCEFVCPDA